MLKEDRSYNHIFVFLSLLSKVDEECGSKLEGKKLRFHYRENVSYKTIGTDPPKFGEKKSLAAQGRADVSGSDIQCPGSRAESDSAAGAELGPTPTSLTD